MDSVAKTVKKYDEIAEEYAQKISEKDPGDVYKWVETYLKKGSSVLDAGCAAGRDSHILSSKGYEVTGIDLSKNLLAIAKREHPDITFQYVDVRKLPFKNESFDAVWSLAVIHHLTKDDMKKALYEFFRVLKPNGVVIITVKTGKGLLKIREEHFLNNEREFNLVPASMLDEMLREVGFQKKELRETKSRSGELFWVYALYSK